MVGRYKAYPEYKDSPIDWLDEIPKHWATKKLKHLGEAIIGLTYSPDEVVDISDSDATLVLRSSNVQNQKITLNDNVFVKKQIPKKLTTRLNDILICSRNGSRALIGKNALIDKNSIGMSFGAFMTIYRSKYNAYLSHVMNSKLFEYQSATFLTSTINQLTTGNLNSFEIPFPTEAERIKIANFLDHETAKIDTLIAKQEKLIELLQEKRQAVISHAVTKGLNPDVPMKDSGVEWLGEVPEHWEISKLGLYANKIGSGKTPKGGADVYQDEGILFLRSQNVYDDGLRISGKDATYISNEIHVEMQNSAVKPNDVLLNITGGSIGRTCIFPANVGEANVNQHVCILRFDTELAPYLANVMKSSSIKDQIDIVQVGGNREGLNFEQIANMRFCVPPKAEILKINSFIDSQLTKFDSLILKSISAIDLMKERKTALISAAVTGKIDVRDWSEH
ncbi:restriction endonuclease subunit S [Providencia rettgeri]|uniref:restriction endonuclease subunit S n=1 Tax=Providencia rettgeri TaxID=587 RepID=UPI00197E640B|nr:restriction endonuclease subunit S [Providencia rettgeri]MBN6350238.1 restriction endonuclease subunit S [Providencia rettgeri]